MTKNKINLETIVRRILAEEDGASSFPPQTFQKDNVTYTFVRTNNSGNHVYKNQITQTEQTFTSDKLKSILAPAPPAQTPAPDAGESGAAGASSSPDAAAEKKASPPKTTGETGYKKLSRTVKGIAKDIGSSTLKAGKENLEYGISTERKIKVNKVNFDAKAVDDPDANFVAALILVCQAITPAAKDEATKQTSVWQRVKSAVTGFFTDEKADIKVSSIFDEEAWNTMIQELDKLQNNATPSQVKPILTGYLGKINPTADVIPSTARGTPDDFANYLAVLYESTQPEGADPGILSGAADAASDAADSAASAVKGVAAGASAEKAQAAPADDLLLVFLANNVDLYYRKYASNLADKAKPKNALGAAIKQGNEFGPSARAALTALIETIEERASNKTDLFFTDYPHKIGKLSGLKDVTTKPSWSGAGDKFPPGDEGLIRFLRFTYAASAGPKYNEVETAGAEVGIRSGGLFFSDDPLWQELLFSGAASPFPFLTILGPNNDMIPRDAEIFIELGGAETGPIPTVDAPPTPELIKLKEIKRDYPKGLVMCIGRESSDSATIKGFIVTPDVFDAPAKNLLNMMGKPVRFILKIGDEAYVLVTNLAYATPTIDFKAIVPKPAPAAGPSASDLAREVTNITSRPGRTVAGSSPGFEMDNVYIKQDGSFAVRRTNAILQKRVPVGAGDDFELRVTNPNFEYILVPVRLRSALGSQVIAESKRMLHEQTAHWVVDYSLSRQQLAAPGPGSNVGFLPVQSIRWKADKNMVTYGPGGFSVVDASYDPTPIPRESLPPDINIITPEQAMRMGEPGPAGNPIKYAIMSYVVSDTNPLGTPLYLSKDVNTVINNTFRRANVSAGGFN